MIMGIGKYFYKEEDKEFLEFHYKRLFYQDKKDIIDYYNREVVIGMTGERMQILFLIILHKLFLEHFNESPVWLIDNHTVKTKGKVYLIDDKIFYNKLNKI